MDDDRLGTRLRALMMQAIDEATGRGAGAVEAEHVLLAITARRTSDAAMALAAGGLGYDTLGTALREERRRSLAAAGISPVDSETLEATPRRNRPHWGTSIQEAMGRAHRHSTRDRKSRTRLAEADIAIGILKAKLGTVPRALAFAGIDPAMLITHLQRL